MTSRFFATSLAVLAAIVLTVAAVACGDSVGNYCDYTDCNAAPDAAADAGSDAS
jgi:hypothetical protein